MWKDVPGFNGRYQVSDDGYVRSTDFFDGRRKVKGRVLKPYTMSSGHLQVMLGRGHSWLVHQLVALTFIGPCPDGQEVLHGDHTPAHNNVGNLKYGTRSENMKMDYAAGTRKVSPAWIYSQNGKRTKHFGAYTTRGQRGAEQCDG